MKKKAKVEKLVETEEITTWQLQDETERDWEKNFYAPHEKTIEASTTEGTVFVESTHEYFLQGVHPETGKLVKCVDPVLLSASGLLNYSKTGVEKSGFCMNAIYKENIKQRLPLFLSTYFCLIKKVHEGHEHGMEFIKCTLKCEKRRQFVFGSLGVMCFDQLNDIFKEHIDMAKNKHGGVFSSYVERETIFMACQTIVDSVFVVDSGMNPIKTCYQNLITNRSFNEVERHVFIGTPIEQTAVKDICLLLSHSKQHLSYYFPSLLHLVQQHEPTTEIFFNITNRARENGTTLHAYMEDMLKNGHSDIVLPDLQDKVNTDAIFNDYLNPMFKSGKFKFREDLSEVAIGSLRHKICGKSDLIIEDLTTKELFIMDFKRADLKELDKVPFVPIGSIGRKYNFDAPPTKSGDIYKYTFQGGTYRKLHMLHGYKVKPFIFLIGISPGKIGWTLTRISLYGKGARGMDPVAKTIREVFIKRENEMVSKYFGSLC